MENKIFIACDFNNKKELYKFLSSISTIDKSKYGIKIGLELFSRYGCKLIEELKDYEIFLDLKLFDIPTTLLKTLYVLNDYENIKYITISLLSNSNFKFITNKTWNFKIFGVTILTSLSDSNIADIGFYLSVRNQTLRLAAIAHLSNIYGIVCSVSSATTIKSTYPDIKIMSPGIRLNNKNLDDHIIYSTPKSASINFVDFIVVGRIITQSKDPIGDFNSVYEDFIG